ncbi:DNA polymerase III subunit chi [Agarivorans gilvus]|uniref:DNA polymerase III subunit chi n=1 Tax=Agarivorans gilvus TaxID=680279 RepID=A0ABQ1I0R9_9ALTE|nr:DNA polymerase III subunit chi [Agarivorans gilvus]GGB05491.1 DNA polymerase III subunit chi [Agarivorans gilvus]
MKAKFYIMPDSVTTDSEALDSIACQILAQYYQAGERILVYTSSKQHAERLDEVLWQFEPEQFVPHNLSGEGPQGGAPVEITWQAPRQRRQCLVNLTNSVPDFARNFQHIIDFVPADETGKAAARERYRVYRQQGLSLDTAAYTNPEII